jgi:hypothetical protein
VNELANSVAAAYSSIMTLADAAGRSSDKALQLSLGERAENGTERAEFTNGY